MESAVEYLTSFRHAMSHDFRSVCTVVATDYQAMYAYKLGFYEHCYKLCTDNVDRLLHGTVFSPTFVVPRSDLLLLVDDDILSLIGLATLSGAFQYNRRESVSQLALSAYFLIRSKLQMKHPQTSFFHILRRVLVTYRRYLADEFAVVNRALLAYVYHKTVSHFALEQCDCVPWPNAVNTRLHIAENPEVNDVQIRPRAQVSRPNRLNRSGKIN